MKEKTQGSLPGAALAELQRRRAENTLEDLKEAVRLAPTNGLAFARLARQILVQSEKDNPRRVGEADFYSRYALRWAPDNTQVQKIQAEIARQINDLPKP